MTAEVLKSFVGEMTEFGPGLYMPSTEGFAVNSFLYTIEPLVADLDSDIDLDDVRAARRPNARARHVRRRSDSRTRSTARCGGGPARSREEYTHT